MKLRIVGSYAPRYRRGHAFHFVPPVTGIHLAAITPAEHEVEVIHEQVREVPVDETPDLVALSFFPGFARNACSIADRHRALGAPVVAGGPHVSYRVDEALQHVDAVVIGEAESVWSEVLRDFERGTPKPITGNPPKEASIVGEARIAPPDPAAPLDRLARLRGVGAGKRRVIRP